LLQVNKKSERTGHLQGFTYMPKFTLWESLTPEPQLNGHRNRIISHGYESTGGEVNYLNIMSPLLTSHLVIHNQSFGCRSS